MANASFTIRLAEVRDAEDILRIYAPYVEGTSITFETAVPSLDEFEDRMRDIVIRYPYLVALHNGRIVGYAYAHRRGERAAYAWNAELSVYLDSAHTGRRLGWALSQCVLELLALQGVRNVFSLITIPNEPSLALHEALGFKHMGTQVQAGYKCGAWHDVAWMQKQIGDFSGTPKPVCTLRDIDSRAMQEALLSAERAVR